MMLVVAPIALDEPSDSRIHFGPLAYNHRRYLRFRVVNEYLLYNTALPARVGCTTDAVNSRLPMILRPRGLQGSSFLLCVLTRFDIQPDNPQRKCGEKVSEIEVVWRMYGAVVSVARTGDDKRKFPGLKGTAIDSFQGSHKGMQLGKGKDDGS